MTVPACIQNLRDYVAIPSVNPMGRSDVPHEIAGERRYAEHVREQLRTLGVDAEVVGSGERCSVVGTARSPGARETILVASHLDTVPVDHMQIDPFDPKIESGRLHGRGACDTKAGMAALMAALARVLERGRLRRNLIVVGEADEEYASIGVADVLSHLGDGPADWALVTEPTGLRLVTHHKGIVHASLVARGRACHASIPEEGRNAIVALSKAVLALDTLNDELAARTDPQLGRGTLSIGMMHGGQSPNIVPDRATLVLDRRLLPHENEQTVREELAATLARHGVMDVEINECFEAKPPLATDADAPAVLRCRTALASSGLHDSVEAVGFGTDAGLLARHQMPSVVMGPGSIAQAHTDREFVELSEVEDMTDFFIELFENDGR